MRHPVSKKIACNVKHYLCQRFHVETRAEWEFFSIVNEKASLQSVTKFLGSRASITAEKFPDESWNFFPVNYLNVLGCYAKGEEPKCDKHRQFSRVYQHNLFMK